MTDKDFAALVNGQVAILEAIQKMSDQMMSICAVMKEMIPKCDCPPNGTTLEGGSSWYCPRHGRQYVG